jgi:protein AbiQ
MFLYTIDTDYIEFLARFQEHIWINEENNRLRPYVGVVLDIGEYQYYAPLSSPKPKHLHMKDRLDFIRLEYKGTLKGVINLNNIIPVSDSLVTKIDIQSIVDVNYKNLLNVEMIDIRRKRSIIQRNAKTVYNKVTKFNHEIQNAKLIALSYNFLLLEQKMLEYLSNK